MIYLILSVLMTSSLVLYFKVLDKLGIQTLPTIIINYIISFIAGNFLSDTVIIAEPFWTYEWFPLAVFLGFLFILNFYLFGFTAQKIAVSVSIVASKMSVIIPVGFAVLFLKESFSAIKAAGILLSMSAVYLTTKREDGAIKIDKRFLLLPLAVFVFSGVVDTCMKIIETNYLQVSELDHILTIIFMICSIIGILFALLFRKKFNLKAGWRELVAGAILFIPNYFSLYFLVKTLNVEGFNAAYIFPINNISIVTVSTLGAVLFFREKISKINLAGILIAVISIAVIALA